MFGQHDEVAEWLRRWTANPMGSARVGSNPIFVVNLFPFLDNAVEENSPLRLLRQELK